MGELPWLKHPLLTHRDRRLDSKLVKQVIGKHVFVCSNEEMIEAIGCEPGAVCPFALPGDVRILVDPAVFNYPELMFTPGKPDFTFAFASSSLLTQFDALPNTVIQLPETETEQA